jgi:hypothetical protein
MAKTALKKTDTEKGTASKKETKKKAPAKKKKIQAKSAGDAKSCKIDKCKREYKAKGYCKAHYKKWRQGEYGLARYKSCKELNCFKPMALNRHGMCEAHFQDFYVKGLAHAKAPAAAKPDAAEKADKADKAAVA